MMYTYAFFLPPHERLLLPHGIAGTLRISRIDQLSALVEPDLNIEQIRQDDAQLMQAVVDHDRILRELFEQLTVLPLRFGTQFRSEAALLEHLSQFREPYLEAIARLQGQAEYALKFLPLPLPEVEIPTEAKGKSYFLAKKQRFQEQLDQQQQQALELQSLKDAIAQSFPTTVFSDATDQIERAYLLLPKDDELALHQQIQHWRSHSPHWQISISEALPPYHFV